MIPPMRVDWFPLWLSLRVAAIATILSFPLGLAAGWWLAKKRFRGWELVEAAISLPLYLPSTVLGYYLLVLLANQGALGRMYESVAGRPLLFTWQAAVVAAMIHVVPLLFRSCRAALEETDPDCERAARSFGASQWRLWWFVTLPQARTPLLAAAVLAFARALGEFGVTIMVAGNLPGRTQTLPVAVYSAVVSGDGATARVLVLVISAVVLSALYAASRLRLRQAAG